MAVPTPTYTDGDWGYDLTTVNGVQKAVIVAYLGAANKVLVTPARVGDYDVYQIGKGGSGETLFPVSTVFTGIDISYGPEIIGNDAFAQCNQITGEISLPDSLTSIGDNAFRGLNKVTGEVIVPSKVTSVGAGAFRYMQAIQSISIGASVTSIGLEAFAYGIKVRNIVFLCTSAPTIGSLAFGLGQNANKVTCTVRSLDNWASTVLDNYKNGNTTFIYASLTSPYNYMTAHGKKVQVESAIRDGYGVDIASHYAKKIYVDESVAGLENIYAKKDEVYDSTITINNSGGTAIDSFTLNQSSDKTITLPMGAVQYNNVSATFATYTPDATETGAGLDAYAYRADVVISGITSSSMASVTFSSEQASSGQYAPACRTENGHLYLYAQSNVGTITVPTITIGVDYSDITIDSAPTLGSTNAVSSGGTYTAIQNARVGLCKKYSGSATIATSSWSSSGVTAYPYKADISVTGITADDYAQVSFASAEASSGNYDSGCDTLANVVRIYAKAVPSGSITVTYMVIQNIG